MKLNDSDIGKTFTFVLGRDMDLMGIIKSVDGDNFILEKPMIFQILDMIGPSGQFEKKLLTTPYAKYNIINELSFSLNFLKAMSFYEVGEEYRTRHAEAWQRHVEARSGIKVNKKPNIVVP